MPNISRREDKYVEDCAQYNLTEQIHLHGMVEKKKKQKHCQSIIEETIVHDRL